LFSISFGLIQTYSRILENQELFFKSASKKSSTDAFGFEKEAAIFTLSSIVSFREIVIQE
jgi:hypothetical protein